MQAELTATPRTVEIITKWGTLEDIIKAIMRADHESQIYVKQLAEDFRSLKYIDTASEVWSYWKNRVKYVEDPVGKQIIQSPAEFNRRRKKELGGNGLGGDCKSFSIACGSIFQALGIPYKYRFISERAGEELHHVYIVVANDILVDCVYDYFNAEIPHAVQVDVDPKNGNFKISGIKQQTSTVQTAQQVSLENVTSIDDMQSTSSSSLWKPALAVTAGFLLYKTFKK